MSARNELRDCFLSDSRDRFEAAADAYRAEILAEDDSDRARLDRELRGRIEHEKAGKARWRERAEKAEEQLKVQRAEVERELLGDEMNPSPLVLNAVSYRLLVERIEATMASPDQWDGDDAEVEILARYVEWLAGGSPMEDGWPIAPNGGESRA